MGSSPATLQDENRDRPTPAAGDLPRWRFKIAVAVGLLLVIGLVYLAFWWLRPYEVIVINGLSTPYTATIDGKVVKVPAQSFARASVQQGTVNVSVKGNGLTVPDQTLELRMPLWRSSRSMTVINPDHVALIALSSQEYGAYVGGTADATSTLEAYAGQPLYQFDHVDYLFEEFPQQVPGGGTQWKWKLDCVQATGQFYENDAAKWLDTVRWSPSSIFDQRVQLLERRLAVDPQFAESLPKNLDSDIGASFQAVFQRLGYKQDSRQRWIREQE